MTEIFSLPDEFYIAPRSAQELSLKINVYQARKGDAESGRRAIEICGYIIAKYNDLPRSHDALDYLVRFCANIGKGHSLAEALGAKSNVDPQNKERDKRIAERVDFLWLFGKSQANAIDQVAKEWSAGGHKSITTHRVKQVFKKYRGWFDKQNHDDVIVGMVHRLVSDNGTSADKALGRIWQKLNPRCEYSDWDSLKETYQVTYVERQDAEAFLEKLVQDTEARKGNF